jgi:hypothetical protein
MCKQTFVTTTKSPRIITYKLNQDRLHVHVLPKDAESLLLFDPGSNARALYGTGEEGLANKCNVILISILDTGMYRFISLGHLC